MYRRTLHLGFFHLLSLLWSTAVVHGHGILAEPPSRSSASRFGFNTPKNDNDHQLNCGGYWNQWRRNYGRCGICGDPYQGPRENEAGGKYATGTIVRHYQEGQLIDIEIDLTVGHGGWSEFRVCPNNDVSKVITQRCLDQYLLATPAGETRIRHQHVAGHFRIQFMLPQGLTCSQCVLQWKWNSASNNNCNYITHQNCCEGCGPQEQFYGCADVSIRPRLNSGQQTTRSMLRPVTTGYYLVGGFIPIDVIGRGLDKTT